MRKYKHRKIYEENFGPIPVDAEGRTYDVHHRDGNHQNNDPLNLIALSIDDHYQVHLEQGDYVAAMRIIARKNVPVQILSELASKANKDRVKKGQHYWQTEEHSERTGKLASEREKQKVENKTHLFLDIEWAKQRYKKQGINGRLPSQIKKECPFCKYVCSVSGYSRHVKTCGFNPKREKIIYKLVYCEHCEKNYNPGPYKRWHGDNCKNKK